MEGLCDDRDVERRRLEGAGDAKIPDDGGVGVGRVDVDDVYPSCAEAVGVKIAL